MLFCSISYFVCLDVCFFGCLFVFFVVCLLFCLFGCLAFFRLLTFVESLASFPPLDFEKRDLLGPLGIVAVFFGIWRHKGQHFNRNPFCGNNFSPTRRSKTKGKDSFSQT